MFEANYVSHILIQAVLFLTDGKALDEVPPIPGYKGFIPHVRTSDIGLGSRFHNMAKEGYDALYTQKSGLEDESCASAADGAKVKTVDDDR